MPLRPVNREQWWLLPPTLDDLLAQYHPARFVAAFVDGLVEGRTHTSACPTAASSLRIMPGCDCTQSCSDRLQRWFVRY